MPNAHGAKKDVAYKKEVTWSVVPAASGAQLLRNVTHVPNVKKSIAESDEKASHRQRTGVRHGVRSVEIAHAGKLSAGTYKDFMAAAVRKAFASVTAISSLSITIAVSGSAWTITRGAGSWLTDGIKFGQVGRLTAGAFNAANLNKNLAVISLTASALTVIPMNGVALVAEGPIASATWTPTGKVTYIPGGSAQTDDSFSFEDFHTDISQSEVYSGNKPNDMSITVPEDGNVDFAMNFLGRDITPATSRYFTSPTAETSTQICHSSDGVIIMVASGEIQYATGFSLSLKGNVAGEPAVGSKLYAAIDQGKALVDGQLSAYFPDAALRDFFLNETTVSLIGIFAGSEAAGADFVGFTLPAVKLNTADKDDGDKPVIRTYTFTSEYYASGGAGQNQEQTSLYIQDSQA